MGGCIGAFYLEQYPEDFAKAVLNAPMLGVNLGGVPSWAARVLCDFKVFGGNGKDRLLTQALLIRRSLFRTRPAVPRRAMLII